MRTATRSQLEPGRAYRTWDLRRWGASPARRARRLVDRERLRPLHETTLATWFEDGTSLSTTWRESGRTP
ncbi:MAG: hypothetical protein KF729_28725 [Sandaracinaceae bacterium]|nr:hypothetical protein [Sandaracinaceae bacterium]